MFDKKDDKHQVNIDLSEIHIDLLRDIFAGIYLWQNIDKISAFVPNSKDEETIAEKAYKTADAMLRARQGTLHE